MYCVDRYSNINAEFDKLKAAIEEGSVEIVAKYYESEWAFPKYDKGPLVVKYDNDAVQMEQC